MKLSPENSIRVSCFIAMSFLLPSLKEANAQGQLMLKLSPFSWLGPSTPTLQAGLEYRFYKSWAFELDYGYQTKTLVLHWNDDKDQNNYHKLKTEIKYYRSLSKNSMYWGLGVFYLPQSYNYSHGTFMKDDVIYNYEKSHIRRDVSVICIKAGYVIKISKYFSIDLFAGIGFRSIFTEHTNVVGLEEQVVPPFSEGFKSDYEYYEGRHRKLHIETGAKINILILKGR